MHRLSPPVEEHTLTIPYSTQKFSNNLIATSSVFYECSFQVKNFNNLLGSQNYISCNGDLFLTPSNLVPASDFPYEQQRIATQYLINTFPLWKRMKDGNWNNLERSIRKHSNESRSGFIVVGGTLGVTTLPDNRGQQQPLYMTRNKANVPTVAVPKLVWKLVYDYRHYSSIVFVMTNNPYRTSTQDLFKYREVVCDCVCDMTDGWFQGWDRKDFTKGYIYCCTWDQFQQNVGIDYYLAGTKLLRKKKHI